MGWSSSCTAVKNSVKNLKKLETKDLINSVKRILTV